MSAFVEYGRSTTLWKEEIVITLASVDGQQQRNALTAAEQALRALAEGDAERATQAALRAHELDQIGLYVALPDAVAVAISDLTRQGEIGVDTVAMLRAAVGPGPLEGLIELL
ncbi:MAG: hypothetical protein M3349_04590 [Actinomycetota bacterium]|nr:hypothetical protein [Actinomycetota bacterium]